MADDKSDLHRIRLAVGSHRGRATNREMSIRRFSQMIFEPSVDRSVSFGQYQQLDKAAKAEKKNAAGYFVGGTFEDGTRKLSKMQKRSVITLDVDSASPEQIAEFREGKSPLFQYRFIGHTTRSHCPEAPRWRLIFFLKRPVDYEEFTAISRVMSSQVLADPDASMKAVDPVSHRMAQVMYLPSISRDQVFEQIDNPGDLIDPKPFLDGLGFDWRDQALLPFDPERGMKRPTDPDSRAENPTEKAGIIGAFCRTYDIHRAIETYLPDTYIEGDSAHGEVRYTYAYGSGANGMVVYDDGLFAFSHHSTDPCAEQLVNSFDLVRIHKYGHLDEDARAGTEMANLASYRAMIDLAEEDSEVIAEVAAGLAAKFDHVDYEDDFETTEQEADDEAPEDDDADLLGETPGEKKPTKEDLEAERREWMSRLDTTKTGRVKPSLHNVSTILENDKRVAPSIEYNLFTNDIDMRTPMRFAKLGLHQLPIKKGGRVWSDTDDMSVRRFLAMPGRLGGYDLNASKQDVQAAVMSSALASRYHPVRQYLEAVQWDGVPRAETLFIDYLGVPDNAYSRESCLCWLIAAVARIMDPGCKFDNMIILGGQQGLGKSWFLKKLGRTTWFRELASTFDNPGRMIESMKGGWIVEAPEMSGFNKAEVETVKQFVSSPVDYYRLAYASRVGEFERQCVFAGTTNKGQYLRDRSGNRRFWPQQVTKPVNLARLDAEADLVWAEVVQIYRARRKAQPNGDLFLDLKDPQARTIAKAEQHGHMVESPDDSLAEQIGDWLDKPVTKAQAAEPTASAMFDFDSDERLGLRNTVTVQDVYDCVVQGRGLISHLAQKSILNALDQIEGWERPGNGQHRFRRGGKIRRGFVRSGAYLRDGYWTPLDGAGSDDDLLGGE